jgi:hypothetical protein
LADLPSLYEPESDVVRCALWRWVAAFSSVAHSGTIIDRDAPRALAALYGGDRFSAQDRNALTGLGSATIPEEEAEMDNNGDEGIAADGQQRWDLAALTTPDRAIAWPSPLAAMAYEWAPRNDLLLWATFAPTTIRSLPTPTIAMLNAAATVADAVRGRADLETDAVLDADSLLCQGGRIFALMNVADRTQQWGLPERERVDSLPDDGAITTIDEAREVDRRAAETGDRVEALTVRVLSPYVHENNNASAGPHSVAYERQQRGLFGDGDDDDNNMGYGDDDGDDGNNGGNDDSDGDGDDDNDTMQLEPRTRWVARLPGPPIDAIRLANAGLWRPILAANTPGQRTTAESLYRVLSSEPFVDLAIGVINERVQELSEPSVEARGQDIPLECAQAAAAPMGILPMEVYATYLAPTTASDEEDDTDDRDERDNQPRVVLWVRPVLDQSLIDPDGRDWWRDDL